MYVHRPPEVGRRPECVALYASKWSGSILLTGSPRAGGGWTLWSTGLNSRLNVIQFPLKQNHTNRLISSDFYICSATRSLTFFNYVNVSLTTWFLLWISFFFSFAGQLCIIVSVFATDSSTGQEKSEKKKIKQKKNLFFSFFVFVSSIGTIDSSPVVSVDLLVDLISHFFPL